MRGKRLGCGLRATWFLTFLLTFRCVILSSAFTMDLGHPKRARVDLPSVKTSSVVEGPSIETKPDYEHIHGPLGKTLDKVFMKLFRSKLAEKVGFDSNLPQVGLCKILMVVTGSNADIGFTNRTTTTG